MNVHNPNVALRAALYLRVSTSRQAEHDVSIPDQRKQGEAWCEARGYQLVETFVEAGASATNDRRPEFQRMIEAGTSKPAPFDVVVVHSFSRFFRDHFELEFYVRKLAKNGIRLVSITQEMGDDPMHVMMRQIMALFDEYQSKENAKHVLRALRENARQGFWNGSLPPVGYRVIAAEQRGAKVKKKLEIDPLHADTIRLIYRLALEGDGDSGQMGVKAIVKHLNGKGIFTRDGGRWGVGQVHRILTRRTYIGEHQWGKNRKNKTDKEADEIVIVPVPPIIERETFDAVQKLLQARNPKTKLPARVFIGPTLLTGICYCGNCGGAMTIRTGKSGRYRYYACSIRARQGETGCKGRAIPMDKLDAMVAGHIEERLLDPDRLEKLLGSVLGRRSDQAERRRQHIAELQRRAAESELRLKRLYDAIEAGVADLDDPALTERIAGLKVIRDQARADADRAQALLDSPGHSAISPAMIRQFSQIARDRIRDREGGYRRDHLRALAQRVEVADDAIRIMGSKTELLRTLAGGQVRQSAAIGVPRGGLKWRIIGDTESGSGANRRVHILVKPTRPDISTNLVVTTDRRTYMIELRAREALYMPAVAWAYPAPPAGQRQTVPAAPVIPAEAARNYRYGLTGDSPPWRPVSVFDDGRRVYVVFPAGIVQGEMPPIFVLGSNGEPQIVNSRVHQNVLIVDRLFGAAELRLGSGNRQQVVRIVRTNPTRAADAQPASVTGGSPS